MLATLTMRWDHVLDIQERVYRKEAEFWQRLAYLSALVCLALITQEKMGKLEGHISRRSRSMCLCEVWGRGRGNSYLSCPFRVQTRQRRTPYGVSSSSSSSRRYLRQQQSESRSCISNSAAPFHIVCIRTRSMGPKRPNSRSRSRSSAS